MNVLKNVIYAYQQHDICTLAYDLCIYDCYVENMEFHFDYYALVIISYQIYMY